MLYVIQGRYDEGVYVVLDGPDGLDVTALWTEFKARFNVQCPVVPPYQGKMVPQPHPDQHGPGSGHIPYMVPDTTTEDWRNYEAARRRVGQEWYVSRNQTRGEIKKQYPGETEEQMFASYLVQEHGCTRHNNHQLISI